MEGCSVNFKQHKTGTRKNVGAYAAAEKLLEQKKYDEAIEAFLALSGYSDSADRVNDVLDTKNVDIYNRAMDFLSAQRFDEAYKLLLSIKGYKDVEKLLSTDEELGEYFSDTKAFQAYPTEYAIGHGSKSIGPTKSGHVDWWLRSVFDKNRAGIVDGSSDFPTAIYADIATCGVRPAFWLNVESING